MPYKRKKKSLSEQIIDSASLPEKVDSLVGPDPKVITIDRLIPSGITLLNCACSDNPYGAFALGSINTIPGKSASGKTELALSILASCAIDKRFNDYELVLDDAEQSMSFDLDYLFPPLIDRLLIPDENFKYSETIQDFKASVLNRCNEKCKPFIYVLDSLDSLTSNEEMEREYKIAIAKAKSAEAVKELKGAYKTEKAKHIGEALRMINAYIKNSNSALFIIQQTRQRFDRGFGQTDWITSGGEAPFFYSFHQVYLNNVKSLTNVAKNIKHKIGVHTQAQVVKNKLNGKRRIVSFDIYDDFGIDDVASCVDFLKKTDYWKSDTGGIFASEFDTKKSRDALIKYIEQEDLIGDLRDIVGRVWNEIEKEIRLKDRKRRF